VRSRRNRLRSLIAAGCVLAAAGAAAQQAPITPPASPGLVPEYTPPTPAAPPPRTFVLRELRFGESTLLDQPELDEVAKRYLGRTVAIRDLQALVAEVNELYRRKGQVTARAILPPQKIENGIVRIDLVEGRLGQVALSGNAYTKSDYILSRLPLTPGAVIDGARLERDLAWFNRTNDMTLEAAMKPGAAFGQSDLGLKVSEPPRYSVRLFADNAGIPSTGRAEAGFAFQGNGFLGRGDSLNAYYAHSDGADNGSATYRIPVTRRGGALALGFAENTTAINVGPFSPLDLTARSRTLFLSYTQPWVADEKWLVTTPVTLWRTMSRTMISGVKLSDFDVHKLSAGVSLDVRDPGYRVALLQNAAWLNSTNDTVGTDQDRVVFNGTGAALVRGRGDYYAALRGGWQYSPQTDLPPSELFSIGGRNTVRGYTTAFVAGKDGYYYGVEAHRLIANTANVFLFYDEGLVKTSNFPHTRLRGAGPGVVFTYKKVTLDFSAGYALDKVQPEQSQWVFDARAEIAF